MIPLDWMPRAKMQRCIFHWTAGSNKASAIDREHYHFVIEGDGALVRGDNAVTENEAPISGDYAAHCLRCNTGSIGISLCGMAGATERPFDAGRYPITETQWSALAVALADLCKRYDIPVTRSTVLSHAEVQPTLGIAQRGKWDIARLPWDAVQGPIPVGDQMREMVQDALRPQPEPELPTAPEPGRLVIVNVQAPPGVEVRVHVNGQECLVDMKRALIAVDEVDNPWFLAAHPESASNPRRIQAFVNRREDAVSAMRSLKPHQKRAADEFVDIWRTLHGLHGGSFSEHVDHHHAPAISDSVIDAGRELKRCKTLVGMRNYGLLEEVCGRGKSLTELFPPKAGAGLAVTRLQRRIASHNIKTALDDLARMWGYM